jgi:hypothetical protein
VQGAAFAPLFLLYALVVAGCAADRPAPASRHPAAPAARYNLGGYSAAFKEGYADACASPRRRSEARYKADADYQMGWKDGASICRKR